MVIAGFFVWGYEGGKQHEHKVFWERLCAGQERWQGDRGGAGNAARIGVLLLRHLGW